MLHIVTPVSRPENIYKIAKSIRDQVNTGMDGFMWHLVFDKVLTLEQKTYIMSQVLTDNFVRVHDSIHEKALVGHAHRNFFMKELQREKYPEPNWIYFLDDDTILHPDFLPTIYQHTIETTDKALIIFHQLSANGSIRLFAKPEDVKVCHIDMGMYMFNFDNIPEQYFEVDDYCADGIFAEELVKKIGYSPILVIEKPLSYYNFLRP